MTRIVGLPGSLRRASFNHGLLRAAAEQMPAGATLDIHPLDGIPLYNADDEAASGLPAAVVALKDAIASADGVLIATPEYNNGMPGVFKNAIDWASRPNGDIAKVFGKRPFAIIGASPGGFGTVLAQDAWLSVLRTLGTTLWTGGRLPVSRAGEHFNADGDLVDAALRQRLKDFVDGFVAFTKR